MAQIRKLVQAGNIDRAIKLCEAAPLPLLQVVKAGLTQVNRGEEAASVTARWSDLGLAGRVAARDAWAKKDLGTFADEFTAEVEPHGVVLVVLKGN